MEIRIRSYEEKDLPQMIEIWNEVVEEGLPFPRRNCSTARRAKNFLLPRLTMQSL